MAKNPIFGQNWEKWLFFSIFQENSPVATGLKVAKMAKNGHFPENRPKVGVPARGFYINPSRRGPAVPGVEKRRDLGPPGPGPGIWAPGDPAGTLRDPWAARAFRDPPGEPRGPGARG